MERGEVEGPVLGAPTAGPGLVYSSISDRASERDKRLRGRAVVMRQDVQVSRMLAVKRRGEGKRGAITELSDKSRRRLSLVARNVEGLTYLITLTYPDDYRAAVPDGRVLKAHMAALRKRLVRRGIGGLWFVEFQDRGAPHVHILTNGRVAGWLLSEWWYEVVRSGDEKHLRAGTGIERLRLKDGAARYASKYASKWEQKLVPAEFQEVGRMWGLFGGVRPHRFEIEGRLRGEVAAVHRVVRRLQEARSRARLRSVHPVTGEIVEGKLRARVRRRMGGGSSGFFRDAGVHGWTSYGVGPVVELYVGWRRGERPWAYPWAGWCQKICANPDIRRLAQ
jgi:hypothetical protein